MEKATLWMALKKADMLAVDTLQRICHKNWKYTKPRGKSVYNPLQGNPQLPPSMGIRKTFLNQQSAGCDRRVNFRIFFSASHTRLAEMGTA